LNPGVNLIDMLVSSGMDCNNYSSTLIGWSANSSTPNGRILGAAGRQYGTNAVAARTNLTTTKGWTIAGDAPSGAVCGAVSVPTITSFTPTSGPIATTVTITGTNFDLVPANNIVKFNGTTAATPTGVTATNLTVVVPAGATTGTITVTVGVNTATSAMNFTVLATDNSLKFNGSNQEAQLGTWFNFQQFTISMWVKPGATQVTYADIIDNNHTGSRSWVFQQNVNNINQYGFGGGFAGTNITLAANLWQHVTLVKSSTATSIYINGCLATTVPSGAIPYDGTQLLRLANFGGGGGRNWNGEMDEVKIYDRVLTDSEILAGVYTAESPTASNLQAYYKMNQSSGPSLLDATPNARNGTLINSPTFQATGVGSAPPPQTITSFSPGSGGIGTTVIITGTNFDLTPANNIVKFNGTTAVVTASTATSITTTVPAGAITGTISVTVGCSTVTSVTSFTLLTVAISPQPTNATVCDGATAQFTVGASGTTNITYQWQKVNSQAASLNGLRWEIPSNGSAGPDSDIAADPPTVTTTMGGSTGTTYSVTLRFRGVVELKNYSGGTTSGYFNAGGIPDGSPYNIYRLDVSNPANTYYLNAGSSGLLYCFGIDYQQVIPINGGATVQLTAFTLDGAQIRNKDQTGTPIVVPGISPAPAAYNGQFIQMDVVSINGAVGTDIIDGGGYSGATTSTLSINSTGNFGAGDYRCKVSGDFAPDVFSNTVTLTINTLPATPGAISGVTNVCSGSPNAYSIAAVAGATSYIWTLPSGWTGTSSTNSITATASTTSGNITVTATNACGTSAASVQAVTVNSTPSTPGTIAGATTLCSGSSNTYSIAAVSGATSYTWTLPSGWSGTSTTNSITATAGASAGSGNITVTGSNACGTSLASTLAVTVNTAPAAPGAIVGTSTICAGSSNIYSIAAVVGATSYTWTLPTGWTGTSTTNSITAAASATSGNVTVTANNACGTSAAQTLLITVNPLPAAPAIVSSKSPVSGKVVLCSENNETTLLSTLPAGFASYAWSVGGNSSSITVNQTASVTVRVTDANGCQSLASTAVVIDKTSCRPSIASATLSTTAGNVATQPLTVLVTVAAALDLNSLKVIKQPVSGAVATISAGGLLSVNYAGISFVGTEAITIEACDINGICSQQDLTIEVAGDVIVFNAISPNGDNKNEFVRMQYIESIPDTKSNKVMVFNRWGDLVFEINDYDNADRVFRGLDNNGDKLAAGTYYYRIDFNSGRSTKTGFISLKK
jgi:gliding motility-associated-like protein